MVYLSFFPSLISIIVVPYMFIFGYCVLRKQATWSSITSVLSSDFTNPFACLFVNFRLETLVCIGLHVKAKQSRWWRLSPPEPMSTFKIRYIGMRSFSREPVMSAFKIRSSNNNSLGY